jgi:hypothetical protein
MGEKGFDYYLGRRVVEVACFGCSSASLAIAIFILKGMYVLQTNLFCSRDVMIGVSEILKSDFAIFLGV